MTIVKECTVKVVVSSEEMLKAALDCQDPTTLLLLASAILGKLKGMDEYGHGAGFITVKKVLKHERSHREIDVLSTATDELVKIQNERT